MELTVQIVVENNRDTIARTLDSVRPIATEILVADLGSTDGTPSLCSGCKVFRHRPEEGRDAIRESLVDRSGTDWQMCLNPWEILVEGSQRIGEAGDAQRVKVLQGNVLTNEVRFWRKSSGARFRNPVHEYLDANGAVPSHIFLYSTGDPDLRGKLAAVEAWEKRFPLDPRPVYYGAITRLALGDQEGFLKASERYMFLDPGVSMGAIMNRYYYAMVQVYRMRRSTPALQNLAVCIEANPLMAEFWCLLGDVHYHLHRRHEVARKFYEDAMFLGSRRLDSDPYPMDVEKYCEYPTRMVESCHRLSSSATLFVAAHEGVQLVADPV